MTKFDVYLKQNPKNKLIFTKNELSDFLFTDMGHELAEKLTEQHSPSVVATSAFESVVSKGTHKHPQYGEYLAMKNIGILFEPSLLYNIRLLFESLSHDTTLIVCSDGIIQNDIFYFNEPTDNFKISLSGLSYLVI